MKLVYFDCSCGRNRVLKCWSKVVRGHTKTCGRCNILTAEHFRTTKYGKLIMKNPVEIHRGSNRSVVWVCDCGNEKSIPVTRVTSNCTGSCGLCNVLTVEYFKTAKYGKLRMKVPVEVHKSSGREVDWICDCGNEIRCTLVDVTRGHVKTCGRCNQLDETYWSQTSFGRLRMRFPKLTHLRSNTKVGWICDCGNSVDAIVQNVTRGRTTSCGMCRSHIDKWYEDNKQQLLSLKTPILDSQIPPGGVQPTEPILKTKTPFASVCPLCKSVYYPNWDHVRQGVALTCGCSTNRVSLAQRSIAHFIESLGHEICMEYSVDELKYDILIRSQNILLEYNGLRWHSSESARFRDFRKYQNALSNHFGYMMIFEDEWTWNQEKVQSLLRHRLVSDAAIKLRPSKCEIRKLLSDESDTFYERHHYIGPCKAPVNYGVFYGEMVGCMSFKHPTRQSRHEWELVRMASDPRFRVHGIWSKLLDIFVHDFSPSSIVSFSDNRLFPGNVYQKIGFRLDGEIPPDYYWCKGTRRFHKSGLRKRANEKLSEKTERELREADGYSRVWDVGKKRWVLDFSASPGNVTSNARS